MHLRPVERKDIPALVSMTIECDKTDALANYLLRHQNRYPTSLRRGMWYFIRSKLAGDGGTISFVLETDSEDHISRTRSAELASQSTVPEPRNSASPPGQEIEVIGAAVWTRHGTSPIARTWQRRARGSPSVIFDRILLSLEEKYNALFPNLNRTLDRVRLRHVMQHQSDNDPWERGDEQQRAHFAESWRLELLQVHPRWQRQGLSKVLLSWGLERAQEERVPILVTSSPLGNFAYRSAGFKSVGDCGFGGLFDETAFGGESMQAWVWEPVDVPSEGGRDRATHQ